MQVPNPSRWTEEIGWRMRHLFLLKLAGTSVAIWCFFVGYFHLLRHPAHAVTPMPLTALDALVPLQPAMLYPYLSLWLYVGIAPGLMPSFRALCAYGAWTTGLCLAGLGIFYAWPTEVPASWPEVSGVPGFRLLQGVDATGNACPSMHVAFAIFTAIWLGQVLRQVRAPWLLRAGNWLWFLTIAWSTVAIRQHVVLDVLAGAGLGMAFALASLRWHPHSPGARGRAPGGDMIKRMPADIAP